MLKGDEPTSNSCKHEGISGKVTYRLILYRNTLKKVLDKR